MMQKSFAWAQKTTHRTQRDAKVASPEGTHCILAEVEVPQLALPQPSRDLERAVVVDRISREVESEESAIERHSVANMRQAPRPTLAERIARQIEACNSPVSSQKLPDRGP